VDYPIRVSCIEGRDREVNITQKRWEWDPEWNNDDDYLGTSFLRADFPPRIGTTTVHNVRTLVDGEGGPEDVYQEVKFKVCSGTLCSPETSYESSPVTSISN
jgi:hypothetical protein